MVKGKITPGNLLHLGKDSSDEYSSLTVDNILDFATSNNVSDALKNLYGSSCFLRDVRPVNKEHSIAGFVRTVDTSSFDWGTCIKGIYACQKDEVLFIRCSNDDYAVWGGLASTAALLHGVKATVILGCSRDTEDVSEIDYPLFSRGVKSCAGLALNEGSIDVPLVVDDFVVKTGDFIVCDIDGCVVVSHNRLDDVLEEVGRIKDFEKDCVRRMINEGVSLDNILGI